MATNNTAEMIPRIALKGTLGVSGPLNSDYDALINKPQINGNELAGNKTNAELGIPTELADLTADADHRTVSDTEKETWNAKSDFSGSYDDLTDIPEDLVEDAEYVHTDNNYTSAEKTKLGDIESGAEVNVQADWNETDTSGDAYIKNKPTIPAAQVNSDWNASSGVAEILHKPTLGTAAAKDYTGSVLENSTDLVESGAVKTAIDNAISSVYKPAGNKACAELVSTLLIAANLGNVYNMTDDGVTTADFVEGAGKAIEAGDNVVIVDIGSSVYKFDLLSGMVDLSNYVQKSSTSGLIKNDGTIDQTAYAKQNEMSVSTNGDQTTIQLKNGTTATAINAHQDISGKANKSEMTVTPGTGSDADKTTIQLKSGIDATVLTQHQDISGKVDKEQGKGLSTNDYTTAEKEKLAAISTEANKVTASETNGNIQIDGTETTVYDDTELQGAVSDLEDDVEEIQGELTTELATVEGNPLNFSTKSAQNAKSTILSCEPIQDLHGYDKPWVGGAGKNLLPLDVATIKSLNTGGTWSGNAYVFNNVTFTILTDSDGNITGIKANGTANANGTRLYILMGNLQALSGMILNCINTSLYYTVYIQRSSSPYTIYARTTGSDITIDAIDAPATNIFVEVSTGRVIDNVIMQPMIRLSTVTDATFEPYTNIASISGRSSVDIDGCGKNLVDTSTFLNGFYDGNDWNFVSHNNYRSFKVFVKSGTWVLSTSESVGLRRIEIDGITSSYNEDITTYSITVSKDCYIGVSIAKPSDSTTFQLEYGSQSTEYSAYQSSNDVTIAFGQTVYGGTLDVENGVLVVDRKIKTITDSTGFSLNATSGRWYAEGLFPDFDISTRGSDKNISNQLKWQDSWAVGVAYFVIGTARGIYINRLTTDETLSDLATRWTANPIQICYCIEPITINLTPNEISLLEGVNNISTTGDKITLTYRDGSVATLGDLTSAVDNLDSKIDESKILTDTVTGDKYILVVTNGVLSVEQVSD